MTARRPPTLRDVAREAGLGLSTVSLALRNRGTVSAATCVRVQQIAQRLGYRANPLLASLAANRFRPGRNRDAGLTPLVSLCHSMGDYDVDLTLEPHVHARAAQLGYRIETIDLAKRRDPLALGRQLYHRGVAGVILGQLYGLTALPPLPWEAFSVVSRGRQRFPAPFSVVRFEIFNALMELWERMRARGYRRIGWAVLRHEPEHPDDRARQAAALFCIDHSAVRDRVPLLRWPLHPAGPLRANVCAWAERHRPDLIVGFHPGVMRYLQDVGWRFPGDAGFASLHVNPGQATASVAGLVGDNSTLRLHALELMDLQIRNHLRGPQAQPSQLLIPPQWVEGHSVRPPP
jgi:LacI family transcriptional regulator